MKIELAIYLVKKTSSLGMARTGTFSAALVMAFPLKVSSITQKYPETSQ